jgi:hypothetical protein
VNTLGDPVRLAEGRTAAWYGVPKPQGGEGRHARLAALVQRNEDALDLALSQPSSVEEASTRSNTRPRSLTAKVLGVTLPSERVAHSVLVLDFRLVAVASGESD